MSKRRLEEGALISVVVNGQEFENVITEIKDGVVTLARPTADGKRLRPGRWWLKYEYVKRNGKVLLSPWERSS
jgi:hypothetical protein